MTLNGRLYLDNSRLFAILILIHLALIIPIVLKIESFFRPIVGFFYLTFVPGFLIFRTLKLKSCNSTETLIYSVGLSISFLMFTGALINALYPLLGIQKPISEMPLTFTFSVITLLLCVIFFLYNKNYSISFEVKRFFCPHVFFSVLLPVLSIVGSQLLRFYESNITLLILLLIISLAPILVALNRLEDERKYPLIVLAISIALLYHNMLINPVKLYENELAGVVAKNGYWSPSADTAQSSLLAVTMILPIYSSLCKVSVLSSFFVIYPLIYSITPLILYLSYTSLTNNKNAFLSSFLFMCFFSFYNILAFNVRTGIAELFLAFLLLLLVSTNISPVKKSFLFMIFAFSLITSHYATSYIFMFALIFAFLMILLLNRTHRSNGRKSELFSPTFITLYMVLVLAWYMYTASSYNLMRIPKFFLFHIKDVISDFVSPSASYLAYALTETFPAISIEVLKYLLILSTVLIGVGVLSCVYERVTKNRISLPDQYLSLSVAFLILFLSLSLTAGAFGVYRTFHISLVFLSPFMIKGILNVFKLLNKISQYLTMKSCKVNEDRVRVFFSLFLVSLFLFSSGWVSEVIIDGKDYAPSVLISKDRLLQREVSDIDDVKAKDYFYRYYTPTYDIHAITWLVDKSDKRKPIFTDFLGWVSRFRVVPDFREIRDDKYLTIQPVYNIRELNKFENGYVVLFHHNTYDNIIIINRTPLQYLKINDIEEKLEVRHKVYTGGYSEIYYREC